MSQPRLTRRVKCKCPKCGAIHTMKMDWKGNGMPRKYCHTCKNTAVKTYSSRERGKWIVGPT